MKQAKRILMAAMAAMLVFVFAGCGGQDTNTPEGAFNAGIAAVNPNTMQKALSELVRTGLVYSHRTSGRFITEDSKMIEEMKCNLAKEEIQAFLKKMEEIGFTKEEAIETIKEIAEEMK